jgi:hypothetical protein
MFKSSRFLNVGTRLSLMESRDTSCHGKVPEQFSFSNFQYIIYVFSSSFLQLLMLIFLFLKKISIQPNTSYLISQTDDVSSFLAAKRREEQQPFDAV